MAYHRLVSMSTIDPAAPVAIWRQIVDDLRRRADQGEITGQFPSVAEIAASYGVARGTANKALQRLADEGAAVLVRGRGYFVPV
jgi:DNA-binding GntR family transcriptional regulator